MTTEAKLNIEGLQAQMATAISKNDIAAMENIAGQIIAGKKERVKAQADILLMESEALAGKREALATQIHGAIKVLASGAKQGAKFEEAVQALYDLDSRMREVKGWGFTYKVDKANPAELDVSYKTVALTTATVKARKAGGGGGNGKSAEEFGKSLSDIAAEFGTAEELAAINAEGVSNSKSWQLKTSIKKRAIAAGQLKPVK